MIHDPSPNDDAAYRKLHRVQQPWRPIGPKPSREVITPLDRVFGAVLAVLIGMALAAWLVIWWSTPT